MRQSRKLKLPFNQTAKATLWLTILKLRISAPQLRTTHNLTIRAHSPFSRTKLLCFYVTLQNFRSINRIQTTQHSC